ncbi:serine--tRNA ligase [Neoehrlichia mikurensis]|uniref:Serine--tRNA ligase n=1 Tax=Neoehrlichia mikurensis TaxID=89586 RepID=A0A9Q9BUK2_9RICK|nr:serine--tRNA ligase [Neoehrlichia mikurensis]QXK92006.1 serine--tRNA ligase [Neoehrlichia mikurensis]QXK92463.1 serine--tRNA ligase [Neoehrlichia mikurensis]QXK93699.1 serine--tRNA ligase [Neoehrlichia mikurensis]UTO55328.1 serine--tRNA ligase [Neoehrlichia mikurensis]UTO56249.1 serine--tRNA ligase [Neoehrlichia mikurensis]
MHNINFIRNNPKEFDNAMQSRNFEKIAHKIITLDSIRKQLLTQLYELQKQHNKIIKEISILKSSNIDCEQQIQLSKNLITKIEEIDSKLRFNNELNDILNNLPNIPDIKVPIGNDETNNIEVRKHGTPKIFNFHVKTHHEIGEKLNLMDFKQAAKLSGSRFVILKKQLAQLDRALVNFMLDTHTQEFGYTEVSHPILVNEVTMYNVGQLPKFSEDSFKTTNNFRLIPTSEVALTNLVSNTMFPLKDLPLRFTAASQCFRSEAGSAGRDTKGMIRQHQFNKVELVSIVAEDKSEQELERMVKIAENILQKLELPYRVMLLCTGDMGFSSSMSYDLEVWMAGQKKYREISSCSNCKDFQARRMNAKYFTIHNNHKISTFVHTLNGSALAIGRTIAAIIEYYQNKDGSISIPYVLRKYMHNQEVIQ